MLKDADFIITPIDVNDIEIREAVDKTAGVVRDVDHVEASGKEAYSLSLEAAIDFLWKKVNEDVPVNPGSKTSVERAAAYYAAIDNAISRIVTADVTCAISDSDIERLDHIRSTIQDKHREILSAELLAHHQKPSNDECEVCGSVLFNDKCLVCNADKDEVGLKKEAATPVLHFYENGFIVGIASDIANYVVSSGMNLNDAIEIAKKTFSLSPREEYRVRKYLGYMGHMAPQMIWLPPAEVRYS